MRVILLVVLATVSVPTVAAEPAISCPATLAADAVTVRPPKGWTGSFPALKRLTEGGVMSGPPEGMGYLVPARSKSTSMKTVLTFSFEPGEEKWLWCQYGGVQLSRRLPDEATECALTYTKSSRGSIEEMYATCLSAFRP